MTRAQFIRNFSFASFYATEKGWTKAFNQFKKALAAFDSTINK
jgi:hypothetical protein